jgi:predicted PurR-regulated permease PerM
VGDLIAMGVVGLFTAVVLAVVLLVALLAGRIEDRRDSKPR